MVYFNPYARAAALWTQSILSKEDRRGSPACRSPADLEHCSVAHGTLYRPELFDYIQSPTDADPSLDVMPLPVCFVGHTHVPVTLLRLKDDPAAHGLHDRRRDRSRRRIRALVNVGQRRPTARRGSAHGLRGLRLRRSSRSGSAASSTTSSKRRTASARPASRRCSPIGCSSGSSALSRCAGRRALAGRRSMPFSPRPASKSEADVAQRLLVAAEDEVACVGVRRPRSPGSRGSSRRCTCVPGLRARPACRSGRRCRRSAPPAARAA